jgi:hypothetical protein
MAIISVNGNEFAGEVFGSRQLIQNSHRDTLTIKVEATGSFDAFLSSFANPTEISITDTKVVVDRYDEETGEPIMKEVTETEIYTDYTLVFKRAIETEVVSPETPDSPAQTKDVYVIGLAQKTYIEKQIELLQQLLKS